MPLVDTVKQDPEDLDYENYRPGKKDLNNERVQKRLEEIEAARKADFAESQTRSTKPPPTPGSDYMPPTWDPKHMCWKAESRSNPTQLKVWDERKEEWRLIDRKGEIYIHYLGFYKN